MDTTYQTWAALKTKYAGAFVAIGNPKFDGQKLLGGFFIAKNKDRLALARRLVKMRNEGILDEVPTYTEFAGEIKLPKNTVLCL